MITSYAPKKKTPQVDTFLHALKAKKGAAMSDKIATRSSVRKKTQELNLFDSKEVPQVFVHGKPFCYTW